MKKSKVCKVILPDIDIIYKQNYRNVYWQVLKILKDSQDAEEAANSTFFKFWFKKHLFKGDCKLSSWLFSIATNEALMILRKRTVRRRREHLAPNILNLLNKEVAPEQAKIDEDFIYAIYAAIDLKDNPILSMIAQGFSNKEIANALNISLPAAKSRLNRMRREIRNSRQVNYLRAA